MEWTDGLLRHVGTGQSNQETEGLRRKWWRHGCMPVRESRIPVSGNCGRVEAPLAEPLLIRLTRRVALDVRSLEECSVIEVKKFDGPFRKMPETMEKRSVGVSDWNGHPPLYVCAPKDFTRTQLIAMFVAYIEKHPEQYNWGFF